MPAFKVHGSRGSVVLMAMCLMLVLAIALTSYINLCYTSFNTSNSSKNGTQAVQLAEMGLEEAMWSLNNSDWSNWTIISPNSIAIRTITIASSTLGQGLTGTIKIRADNYNGILGTPSFVAEGALALTGSTTVSKQLSATATTASLFPNALAGFSTSSSTAVYIRYGATIDSYDSQLGPYGSQTPTYKAVVAGKTVTVTSANIKGYVFTDGSNSPVKSASVPPTLRGPNTPVGTSWDTARVGIGTHLPQYSLNVPATNAGTLIFPTTTSSIGTAGATTPTVYKTTDVSLTGTTKITILGPVQLVCTGDFYIDFLNNSTPSIVISGTSGANASLEVFCTGSNSTSGRVCIDGNGINNLTLDPTKCAIYSKTTDIANASNPGLNTSVSFYGVIYMPNGRFRLKNATATVFGAVAANEIFSTITNTPVVHYDLSLRSKNFTGITELYTLTNWQELVSSSDRKTASWMAGG